MNYLLDSNIIVIYSKDTRIARQIEDEYRIFAIENNLAISIVTLAEISSITHQLRLGGRRKEKLDQLLSRVYQVDISSKDIIEKYAEIDASSQGKHLPLPLETWEKMIFGLLQRQALSVSL